MEATLPDRIDIAISYKPSPTPLRTTLETISTDKDSVIVHQRAADGRAVMLELKAPHDFVRFARKIYNLAHELAGEQLNDELSDVSKWWDENKDE